MSENAETESGKETLVVVSKVKKLIRERAGLNTSQDFIDVLSDKVIDICDSAIQAAKADGRKTAMGRDIG